MKVKLGVIVTYFLFLTMLLSSGATLIMGTPGEQEPNMHRIKPSSPKEESQSYLCPHPFHIFQYHCSLSIYQICCGSKEKKNQEQKKEFDAIGQSKPPQQLTCKTSESKEPVRIVSTHGTHQLPAQP